MSVAPTPLSPSPNWPMGQVVGDADGRADVGGDKPVLVHVDADVV
ncbi:hypothetical protein [Citreicoccus inhibens]|nr:hypothetical protein [Citreicoccus inhibens]